MTEPSMPLEILGQLLFTMMGPVALIPVFAGVTAGMDAARQRRIAVTAFGAACVALLLAVTMGAGMLASWDASPASLIVAAGLVLTLASLQGVLGWGQQGMPVKGESTERVAIAPIAFPTMIRPHGIGLLIIFVAYFPSFGQKLAILGVALAVMAINLGAMLVAHRVMALIGAVPLMILGSVFSILQVALGIQIMLSGLQRMLG